MPARPTPRYLPRPDRSKQRQTPRGAVSQVEGHALNGCFQYQRQVDSGHSRARPDRCGNSLVREPSRLVLVHPRRPRTLPLDHQRPRTVQQFRRRALPALPVCGPGHCRHPRHRVRNRRSKARPCATNVAALNNATEFHELPWFRVPFTAVSNEPVGLLHDSEHMERAPAR